MPASPVDGLKYRQGKASGRISLPELLPDFRPYARTPCGCPGAFWPEGLIVGRIFNTEPTRRIFQVKKGRSTCFFSTGDASRRRQGETVFRQTQLVSIGDIPDDIEPKPA